MSSWQQRCNYLVSLAQNKLRGHKVFDLCRSHLVEISQISRGTIYNHFPHESDLIVAVAAAEFNDFWHQAQSITQYPHNPLYWYLYHYCWRLHEVTCRKRFVISRVMPNTELQQQASADHQAAFTKAYERYLYWNRQQIQQMGEVQGFDRCTLVRDFIRGTMINVSEEAVDAHDVQLYYQYCYALIQLLGQSDKRVPTREQISQWLKWMTPTPVHADQRMKFALEHLMTV
ncbi:TetR/AcrR family transcriptional regulator [Shewanella dokdonensis]|uniref:TetR/AcrR family transcriptional regulator n=1 Tax=Shewanella dokdonensis TaxID=712036 RepID=UPI001FD2113E|nr:TetR/AcrR family transcriptional regulator [Shewanella dokdonensis]MCL1076380.1 TetR/AcrR family transcriptional regulator [Shewanella dokdonensis]